MEVSKEEQYRKLLEEIQHYFLSLIDGDGNTDWDPPHLDYDFMGQMSTKIRNAGIEI